MNINQRRQLLKIRKMVDDLLAEDKQVVSGVEVVPVLSKQIYTIQLTVARFYHLKFEDFMSNTKLRTVTYPRQIAMFLCNYLLSYTPSEIAPSFGCDRSNVAYAIKSISYDLKDSTHYNRESIARDIEALKELCSIEIKEMLSNDA